jgi:hypothetical protein
VTGYTKRWEVKDSILLSSLVVVCEYAVGKLLGVKDKCEEHNVENHIEKLIRDGARREREQLNPNANRRVRLGGMEK